MLFLVIILTLAGMFLSYYRNKLTVAGSLSGGIIAMLVYAGAGTTGFVMMTAFFILATLATSYKKNEKTKSLSVGHSLKRNASQVWANGGVAAVAGAFALYFGRNPVYPLIIASVFSSAAADTISSELGMVKGKRFFNIISFKPEKKGLDGVISLEGSLWGLAASTFIAGIYFVEFGSATHFAIIILAGTIGNLADSVLGALFERRKLIGNDVVNLFNTIIAAVVSWVFYYFFFP